MISGNPAPVSVGAAPPIDPYRNRTRPGGEALLELRGIGIAFGELRALDGIDLSVPPGALHGIIGPTDAGKTTLFDVINGFLAPSSGTVTFAGSPLVGLHPNRVCELGIGRMFSGRVPSFAGMTLLENVIVGAPDDAPARRAAQAALDRVGLAARASVPAGSLTKKELRLMELARALVPGPRVMLLDEPLAELGSDDIAAIFDVIRRLRGDGISVLIIEHTIAALVTLVDELSALDHGRLIAAGRPEDVVRDPRVIEAFVGRSGPRAATG